MEDTLPCRLCSASSHCMVELTTQPVARRCMYTQTRAQVPLAHTIHCYMHICVHDYSSFLYSNHNMCTL